MNAPPPTHRLNLVGRLHKTVMVEGCDPDLHEQLATLLMNACGAVEDWDSTQARLTVVFKNLSAMSTALRFHGKAFGGGRLAVRAANAPATGTSTVKAIADRGNSADGLVGQKRRRAQLLEELDKDEEGDGGGAAVASSADPFAAVERVSEEEQQRFIAEYCPRQLRALTFLLRADAEQWLAEGEKIESLMRETQAMIDSLAASDDAPCVDSSAVASM